MPKFELTPQAIEKFWPLTGVQLGSVLQQSGERLTGEVFSREGKYVYKIADPIKTAEAMMRDTAVFDILNEKKFAHIPLLLKTQKGEDFQQIDQKFVYLLEYIEGKNPDPTPETYSKLAKIMAELHDVRDYPYTTDFKTSGIVPDLYKNSENYAFGAEYRSVLDRLPNFDIFPQALIHTDIHPSNSIQKPDGDIVLVDWDDVGVGTRVLDLGVMAGNLFISEDGIYKEENARAFFKTYLNRQELSILEVNHIFDAGLFFACMYIIYGKGPDVRWPRIQSAIENRKNFEKIYRE